MTERHDRDGRGLTTIVVACALLGAVAVAVALTFDGGLGRLSGGAVDTPVIDSSAAPANPNAPPARLRPAVLGPAHATEEYGRQLVAQTAELLGPDQPEASRRYIQSRLNCGSCHLATGTEPGTLTLLQTQEHYPRFSGRAGGQTDVEDRINECMQRSMNGKPLPMDSPEMIAMAAYLRGLGSQYKAMGAASRKAEEPAPFKTPARAASVSAGQTVFTERCATCHGGDGLGLFASTDRRRGYLFPPLWGPDSFNNGAGMHRVLTAARFIKARMPLGKPTLSDDEAFDVAAYINTQPRPQMANLDVDYPDRAAKPIDNPYGPFADDFPVEQHKFGPFGPIEEHYRRKKTR